MDFLNGRAYGFIGVVLVQSIWLILDLHFFQKFGCGLRFSHDSVVEICGMVGSADTRDFQLRPLTGMREWEEANRWLLYFQSELFEHRRLGVESLIETIKFELTVEEIVLLLQILINHYDRYCWFSDSGDIIKEIRTRMKQRGFRNRDLVEEIGSCGYVSDILNRRKPLTLRTARVFHYFLDIPAEWLLFDQAEV